MKKKDKKNRESLESVTHTHTHKGFTKERKNNPILR